ncbi:hypothetical protein LCGC14_0545890 [marine sediment metagenome]|uniref:Uncharacterized protein n=1 Tax=marine sediment metagenome TaxID=412755 RepID=A0A0F9RW35_9ZZZZ
MKDKIAQDISDTLELMYYYIVIASASLFAIAIILVLK